MPAGDRYLAFIAEGVENALNEHDVPLAKRYLSKLWEICRCMYCHGILDNEKSYHPHFKGYVHDECAEQYHGRSDYIAKNGEN